MVMGRNMPSALWLSSQNPPVQRHCSTLSAMRYLCNLDSYVTVQAATLIGLTFAAASSYIFRSAMARRKKSGTPKSPQSTASTGSAPTATKAATAPQGADPGSAPATPATIQEVDTRPETSYVLCLSPVHLPVG